MGAGFGAFGLAAGFMTATFTGALACFAAGFVTFFAAFRALLAFAGLRAGFAFFFIFTERAIDALFFAFATGRFLDFLFFAMVRLLLTGLVTTRM